MYRGIFADSAFREQVGVLLKKSIRRLRTFPRSRRPRRIRVPALQSAAAGHASNPAAVTAPGRGDAVHDVPPATSRVALLRAPPLACSCLATFPRFLCAPPTVADILESYPRLPAPAIDGIGRVPQVEHLVGGWRVGVCSLIRILAPPTAM